MTTECHESGGSGTIEESAYLHQTTVWQDKISDSVFPSHTLSDCLMVGRAGVESATNWLKAGIAQQVFFLAHHVLEECVLSDILSRSVQILP